MDCAEIYKKQHHSQQSSRLASTRNHPIWDKSSKDALYVRKLGNQSNESYETYREFADTRDGGVVANIGLCLTHQANYLSNELVIVNFFLIKGRPLIR